VKQTEPEPAAGKKQNVCPDKRLDFTRAINPLGCSAKIKSFFSGTVNQYGCLAGNKDTPLVEILSGYHHLPATCFLYGRGSTEFLYLVPKTFRPKAVLVTEPVFRNYQAGYPKPKAVVFHKSIFSDNAFVLNKHKLFKELKRGYRALYLPNPLSPAGKLIPRQDLEEIIHVAKKRNVRVVLDESAIDYHEKHSMKNKAPGNAHLIILRSMSDFFSLPGLRVGYIISHPDTIAKIRSQQKPAPQSLLPERLAGEALKDTGHIRRSRRYFHETRRAFMQKLTTLPFFEIYRGDANFILAKLRPSVRLTPAEICKRLRVKGIRINPCLDVCGLGDRYFRIAVKNKGANNRLISELMKLGITR